MKGSQIGGVAWLPGSAELGVPGPPVHWEGRTVQVGNTQDAKEEFLPAGQQTGSK